MEQIITLTKEQEISMEKFIVEFEKAFGVKPELVKVNDNETDEQENELSDEVYSIAAFIQKDYHQFISKNMKPGDILQSKHNIWLYFKLAELQDQINRLKTK
jgi:hypothetical protein